MKAIHIKVGSYTLCGRYLRDTMLSGDHPTCKYCLAGGVSQFKLRVKESPKEESQDLTVADVKAFIDHELGGYKVVHIGHAHKVINRQFIYESDVTSLALELLQNFTITRKP